MEEARQRSQTKERFGLRDWALMAFFYFAVTYAAVPDLAGHPRSWVGWVVGGLVVLAWLFLARLAHILSLRVGPHLPAGMRKQPVKLLARIIAGIILCYVLLAPLLYLGAFYPSLYDSPPAIESITPWFH